MSIGNLLLFVGFPTIQSWAVSILLANRRRLAERMVKLESTEAGMQEFFLDQAGRPIRPDVRLAGHEIWKQACQGAQALLDDQGPAAELMENTVAQVSRYRDRIGAPESSRKHALLMVAFSRRLRRYAAKLNRLELVRGSGELSNRTLSESWIGQVNARLELARMVRQLSDKNGTVLMLRAAGYGWKDVAQVFGKSPAAIRNSFWREVERIRWPSEVRRE